VSRAVRALALVLAVVALAGALSACGRKGPLQQPPASSARDVPARATPA